MVADIMKQELMSYTVKEQYIRPHLRLLAGIFRELEQCRLAGLRLQVYQMDKNVFIHVLQFENDHARLAYSNLIAFREFNLQLHQRLLDGPTINTIEQVGNYTINNLYDL